MVAPSLVLVFDSSILAPLDPLRQTGTHLGVGSHAAQVRGKESAAQAMSTWQGRARWRSQFAPANGIRRGPIDEMQAPNGAHVRNTRVWIIGHVGKQLCGASEPSPKLSYLAFYRIPVTPSL